MVARSSLYLWCGLTACVLAAGAAPAAPAAPVPGPTISVVAQNSSAAVRPAGPTTFGMIFAKGGMPESVAVKGLATQTDVKRRWLDGSVKHAVLTAALPELPAGGDLRLELVGARVEPGGAAVKPPDLPTDVPDIEVRFAIHKGPAESASLRQALARGQPERVWLSGAQVVERHYSAVPTDEKGKADPDLVVRFRVRHYPTTKSVCVECVVENCHWTSPGNIPYDVRVLHGGKEVYACKNAGAWPKEEKYLGHPKGARWVKRFWVGRPLDDVHVRYDLEYLNRTGLLPLYDTSLQVPEKVLADMASGWAKAPHDILQNGWVYAYFPATGGRPDLGPLPQWTSRYVVSQDRRALSPTLGIGDLSGSCPVHLRDPKNDWYVSLDEHPKYSLNPAGTAERIKVRDAADTPYVLPPGSHFAVDSAHQPSLAYVPYLVTGDFYYLEEMQFWANWCMIQHNYAYRQEAKGLLTPDQIRGTAWALRQLVHAAALSPDDDPARKYFEAKLANNLAYLNDYVVGKLATKPTPLGTYALGAGFAYTGGWKENANKYYSVAGWMHNFLAWSLANVANMGYEDAVPARDYLMKWTIGSFTHADEITPIAGTAYFLFVGQRQEDGKPRWYQTWKEVAEGTFHRTDGTPEVKPPTQVSYPDYGGSYSYIARGVLIEALRAGRPGAAEALKWLDGQLPKRQAVMGSDPVWGFAPPTPPGGPVARARRGGQTRDGGGQTVHAAGGRDGQD